MPAPKTTPEIFNRLNEFRTAFSTGNLSLSEEDSKNKRQDIIVTNLQHINDLLEFFIGPKGKEFFSTTTSKSSTTGEKKNKWFKTYNSRTPFIEIHINGTQIFPKWEYNSAFSVPTSTTQPTTQTTTPDDRQTFQNLTLESAFGGVIGTVSGVLTLYARNPLQMLQIISDTKDLSVFSGTAEADEDSGLPIVTLRFGWKVETENSTIEEISFEHAMSFLVTNFNMGEPGTSQGAEFTLNLQDVGSTQLQNTASNIFIPPGFPQEQLRTILEALMGIRLFTLDDFLYLGASNNTVQEKTFFVSEQNGYLRFNSNTVFNVIESLIDKISARWYSVMNTELDTEISNASSAPDSIRKFRRELETAKQQSNKEKIDELSAAITKERQNLAGRCRLVWVPNIPAKVQTTSRVYYNSDWEDGAYVLLPEIVGSDADSSTIPLIYGPGGSRQPYLYGSAINVAQKALSQNGINQSQTFGDVVSVNSNYSNLLGYLSASVDEDIVYTSVGDRLSNANVTKYSKERLKQINAETKKKADNLVKDTKEALVESTKKYRSYHKRKRSISFSGNISQRFQLIGESEKLDRANPKNLSTAYSSYKSAKSAATERLATRVNAFLNIPMSISLTVLGDPLLLRQGFGAFELLSYFATEEINGENTQVFNTFLSGAYIPVKITHRLDMSGYYTDIQGIKVFSGDVPRSISAYITKLNTDVAEQQKKVSPNTTNNNGDKSLGKNDNDLARFIDTSILNINLDEDIVLNPFLVSTKKLKALVNTYNGGEKSRATLSETQQRQIQTWLQSYEILTNDFTLIYGNKNTVKQTLKDIDNVDNNTLGNILAALSKAKLF